MNYAVQASFLLIYSHCSHDFCDILISFIFKCAFVAVYEYKSYDLFNPMYLV
jgi:hypothetical protein